MRSQGPELVKNAKSKTDQPRQFFCSGDTAPETGIYRVFHGEHRLSHEVTILRGNLFPICAKCTHEVHFELIRAVPLSSSDRDFRVVLHSLPVMEQDDEDNRQNPLAS